MRSILSPLDRGEPATPRGSRTRFPFPEQSIFSYSSAAPRWWEAQPSDLSHGGHHHDHPRHTCIPRSDRAALLLFTLAVFALPAFVGVTAGAWAHDTGAGIPGAILVGAVAAAITLAVGHLLITYVRPIWLKLMVAAVFVAPAAIAGFLATHGIVKHLMLSDAWQIACSVIGAVAVGITAFVRIAGMAAAPSPSGPQLARA
jgi:hypothetical protein